MDSSDILTLIGLVLNFIILLSNVLLHVHLRFMCGRASCTSSPKKQELRKYTDEESVSLTDSSPDREDK